MITSYFLLFGSAFLAATILPFYSEVVLFALLREGGDPILLVLVATLGNTLGAVVNWLLGRYLLLFQDRRWFYFSRSQIEKAQRWYQRYGFWSLLLAWAPVGGDALTLIAGIMKVRLWFFSCSLAVERHCAMFRLSTWRRGPRCEGLRYGAQSLPLLLT